LTRSAICRKWALQGVSSDHVLQIPITGRPSNTSSAVLDCASSFGAQNRLCPPSQQAATDNCASRRTCSILCCGELFIISVRSHFVHCPLPFRKAEETVCAPKLDAHQDCPKMCLMAAGDWNLQYVVGAHACNAHFPADRERVKPRRLGGGRPATGVSPVMSLGETNVGPRRCYIELVSMDVEESIRANQLTVCSLMWLRQDHAILSHGGSELRCLPWWFPAVDA